MVYPPKVLIADPEDAFRESLVRTLGERFQVETCADGRRVLERIRDWEPDVLILELMLPGVDGVELLRRLETLERMPRVLVVTYLASDFVRGVLETLPVSYAMLKPSKVSSVASRTAELLEPRYCSASFPELPEILNQLGFARGRQGYQDLLVGIPMLARQRNQRLGKELYDAIARETHSSPQAVEKAIRDVVKAAWGKGPNGLWLRLFPGAVQCPANKEFLFRMADLISQNRKCG